MFHATPFQYPERYESTAGISDNMLYVSDQIVLYVRS